MCSVYSINTKYIYILSYYLTTLYSIKVFGGSKIFFRSYYLLPFLLPSTESIIICMFVYDRS